MLVLSLVLMGVATFLIECLPTFDSIGILAPILLVAVRFAQPSASAANGAGPC